MTKVVQLQISIKSAGSSALRLHKAFTEEGIQSSIISLQTSIVTEQNIKYLSKKSRIISRLDGELRNYINRKTIKKYGSFSFPILGTNVSEMEEIKNADVIYLHWILGGFLNFSNIEQLFKLKKPVIIVMHDMWWITGGCHHSFDCNKYIEECNNCQFFPGNKKNDLSTKGFKKKLKLYSKYNNLFFISPSQWLYACAQKSLITKDKPVFYIPNAIDNTHFKPFDKNVARQILNINPTETVIAFGAVEVNSPYKGWALLQEALDILKRDSVLKNISILIFGSGYNKNIADAIPFKTNFLGYLDEYSVTIAYNAADVFVVPSLADNQPTTVMESLCCGTAVVGFDVGGIPDMIMHKENGYLAKYKDSEDISNGIQYCIKNKIKGKILPIFEKTHIVKKHLDLINKLRSMQY
ncbi:MAG: glycosyltransferase [Bacteroidota bacterium]|nr:glycosyltransferase [Bacteroidota bacterium]